MNRQDRSTYLDRIRNRYHVSDKKTKAKILDEFCEVCGYNRKYAIRALNRTETSQPGKAGPRPKYPAEVFSEPLGRIWLTAGKPCSKKLKSILPEWIGPYQRAHGPLKASVVNSLLRISHATIDRLLSKSKYKHHRKGLGGTKPGTLLKKHIAIHDNNWNYVKPGYIEADTVALCGDTLLRGFIWCITMTDIATEWTEVRGTWNKSVPGILKQISNIEAQLPFPLLGFDCDNGSEFLNYKVMEYFTKRKHPVKFTRSRPYRKNDNAHVEQKNWTHVRKLLGYERFDQARLVPMVNDLFANEWSLFNNHFIPSMKLVKKTRVGSKYKKIYDKPKTPYKRLLESHYVDNKTKLELVQQHKLLDPFQLKADIDRKLEMIMRVVKVTSNMSQRKT